MLSAPPATAASVSPSRMYCDGDDDRLHAAAAQAVDGQRAGVVRQAAVHARTRARCTCPSARCGCTLPNTHWPMSFGSTLARATASRTTRGAELGGRDVLQAAAVIADGGAHAGQDDDFSFAHGGALLNGIAMILRRNAGGLLRINYGPGSAPSAAAAAAGRTRQSRWRSGACAATLRPWLSTWA